MATRTISNAGGNYNATGTWVEGVVPTSADDVVATATSGQLTMNISGAARSFDFTNYTNTLTMNNTWTVSGVALQTFVSAMTIAGTFNIAITGAGASITSNGKTIPNLNLSGNKTLNDTLNVVNFSVSTTSVFTGNAINCSGNWTTSTTSIGGTTVINLTGTGTVSFGNFVGSGGLNINSAGSLSGNTIGIGLGANTTLNYSGGTLSQMKIKLAGQPVTINGNGVEFESFDDTGVAATQSTVNLSSEFKVKYFNGAIGTGSFNPGTHNQIIFAGTGALNVTQSMNLTNLLVNSVGVIQYKPYSIAFQTGVTHTINILNINGFQGITPNTTLSGTYARLRSSSVGNRANINLLNPTQSIIANTDVTDINFTGPAVYTLCSGGTISNSLNVTNGVIGGGSSISGGAWTFVN
jgi:hypothetical protein